MQHKVKFTDVKVVITSGEMETCFEAGNDRSAAEQIALLHQEIVQLREKLDEMEKASA